MATISKPYTFSSGSVIVSAEVNSDLDTIYNDYNGNITNANISASAAIADTKLASITTAGKVNLSSLVITSQAQGDIIYASGATTLTRLAKGTASQLLRMNVGATAPEWVTHTSLFLTPTEYTDAAVTDTSDRTTTSSTYGDITGVTSTFTPGKAGVVHAHCSLRGDSTSGICYFRLLIDATVGAEVAIPNGVAGNPVMLSWSGKLTAAEHTIKAQFKNTDNVSTLTAKNTVVTARLNVSYPT